MTDRIKNIALIGASITALALGGSAIADAASGGGNGSNSSNNSARAAQRHAGLPPQRADETLLTGDTAAQVRKAALAKVSGATIERIETDADGNAAYEAHIVKSDGTRATVYVNKSFEVVSVESGP
jgi:uncharacterized membrane protein YkoI